MVQTGSKLINKQLSYELPQMRSISEVQTQDHFIWRKGIHSGDKETTYYRTERILWMTLLPKDKKEKAWRGGEGGSSSIRKLYQN